MGLTELAELLSAPDGAAPHAGRDAAQLRAEMFGRLAAVVWSTFAALRGRPKEYFGTPQCFELFGMDVMFDDSLRCWLLEFNALPALETLSEDEREVLLDDVISLAVDPQLPPAHPPPPPGEGEEEEAVVNGFVCAAEASRGFRAAGDAEQQGVT